MPLETHADALAPKQEPAPSHHQPAQPPPSPPPHPSSTPMPGDGDHTGSPTPAASGAAFNAQSHWRPPSISLLPNRWSSRNSSSHTLNREASGDEEAPSSGGTTLNQAIASSLPLRLRLRNHRQPKSISSRTSVSSSPVIVRTYTGEDRSRASSRARSPAFLPSNSSYMARYGSADAKLPPVEAFAFDNVLQAVRPDIQDTLDAIAEICARSRMSLADQYSAHLPPTGEILARPPPTLERNRYAARIAAIGEALTTVQEASSSGENSQASTSTGKHKMTAYGSLRNIATREGVQPTDRTKESDSAMQWIVRRKSNPSILLLAGPGVSSQISDTTVQAREMVEPFGTNATAETEPRCQTESRGLSAWIPWRRSRREPPDTTSHEVTVAESKLKGLLAAPAAPR